MGLLDKPIDEVIKTVAGSWMFSLTRGKFLIVVDHSEELQRFCLPFPFDMVSRIRLNRAIR
jgi:hypothetical protein